MTDLGYHSVYLPPVLVEPVERWTGGGSVAFVHDLMSGPLPAEYDRCDALYADLPWRAGFDRYNARAGVTDGRTYPEFMAAVKALVKEQARPVVLVTGQHARRLLPRAAQEIPLRMPVAHEQPAIAYVYNLFWLGGRVDLTTQDIQARLALAYDVVGDFCCGYGWSARTFTQAGKRFVASDYNPRCVGYIAAHAGEWVADHD